MNIFSKLSVVFMKKKQFTKARYSYLSYIGGLIM